MPKAMVATITMFSSRRNRPGWSARFGVFHAGVIRHRADAVFVQELSRLLDLFARQAVHDAGVARMLGADEVEQLLAAGGLFDDRITDVRAVEGGDEFTGVVELQAVRDLVARLLVGRGRERDARHVGKLLVQDRQADVFRAEIVAPLRDAVRLVDREQRDARIVEQVEAALRHQALGRHVDQVDFAGAHQAFDAQRFLEGLGRIQEGRAHADFFQRIDLVLHQRDQRRDDHAHALAQQRGDLVAQRLAAAGRHQDQGVAAAGDVIDDVGLLPAEGGVTEDGLQQVKRARFQFGGHSVLISFKWLYSAQFTSP
jgi:hypothetical protein